MQSNKLFRLVSASVITVMALATSTANATDAQTADKMMLITNVSVFNGTSGKLISGQDVVVSGSASC